MSLLKTQIYFIILETPEYKHEKIYIQPPTFNQPTKQLYSRPHFSDISVDKLPPNAEIAGGPYYDSPPPQHF